MKEKNEITIEKLMTSPFITGALTVNVSQNSVEYQKKTLVLQPKVLELLVLLCAAQGATQSKAALTSALWPDTIVGPDSLANTVTRLRKVLNEEIKNPHFIETVQRKGYRWLQDVTLVKEQKSQNKKTVVFAMSTLLIVAVYGVFNLFSESTAAPIKTEKFPFPDLQIQRLADGGYEIQVGIEGELTEEKKAAMLQEIKRITGEEHSDMIFTVDPTCQANVTDKATCKEKPLKVSDKNKE